MSTLATACVALLAAIAGLAASEAIARRAVDWYRIPAHDGTSSWFLAGMTALGALAGLAIAIAVSRAQPSASVPRALGISLGLLAALLGTAASVARALADVPPRLGGESSWLVLEVRCPAESVPEEWTIEIASRRRLPRAGLARRRGALFAEDARREDGALVVPGVAGLFTGRGTPVLLVSRTGQPAAAFELPLPRPLSAASAWSPWLPGDPGASPSYRFRVAKRSEPLRARSVGPFLVETISREIYPVGPGELAALSSVSSFRILHRGRPVESPERPGPPGPSGPAWDAAMATESPRPALLAHDAAGACYLLHEDGGAARATLVARTPAVFDVAPLRRSGEPPEPVRPRSSPRGWLDLETLARPGLFLVAGSAVLDTRGPAVHPIPTAPGLTFIPVPAPLALSPDERRFVRFAYAEGSAARPVLVVTDIHSGGTTSLPLDTARLGITRFDALDAAWVARHLDWDAGALRLE